MKAFIPAILCLASSLSVQAATTASVSNFHLPNTGIPIVDTRGVPIPASEATIQIGTFTDAFASTLYDRRYEDQMVIAEFIPTGPVGEFVVDGFFNYSAAVDETGSLGKSNSNNNAYALVIWSPPGRQTHALVFDMGQVFPKQEDGIAILSLGRPVNVSDIAFGAGRLLGHADTSGLPTPFRPFSQGIHIEEFQDLPFEPLELKIARGEEGMVLSFNSHPTFTYQLEYTDDLDTWTIGNTPEFTFEWINDGRLKFTDLNPPAARHYRIVQTYR